MATVPDGVAVYDDGIKPISLKVATDLSAKQYYGVKMSADRTVAIASAAGEQIIGVLQDEPDGSSTATVGLVKTHGATYVIAGGTCTVGGLGTVTSAGKFVDATGTDKEAPVVFLEGTTTDGDRILATLVHGHQE